VSAADKDRDGDDMFSKKRHLPRHRCQDSRLSQDWEVKNHVLRHSQDKTHLETPSLDKGIGTVAYVCTVAFSQYSWKFSRIHQVVPTCLPN